MAVKGGKWEMGDEEFEQQYKAAIRRGKAEEKRGLYAVAARFDKASRRIVVDLANGMTLMAPAHLIEGLQEATAREMAEIEILGAGSGLYWPQLEVDIGVAGLLAGVFGTKAWMEELARANRQTASKPRLKRTTAGRSRKGPSASNARNRAA